MYKKFKKYFIVPILKIICSFSSINCFLKIVYFQPWPDGSVGVSFHKPEVAGSSRVRAHTKVMGLIPGWGMYGEKTPHI